MRSLLMLLVLAYTTTAFAERRPGFVAGEGFTFVFSVGPIQGARARMSVGTPAKPASKDGHEIVAVQGEAETLSIVKLVAPMSASYVLMLDAQTLQPREVTSTETGLHERRFHSRIDGRALDLEVVGPQRTTHVRRLLPREPRDPLSAYFALRSFELVDGETLDLDVLDGAALWRTHLVVVGREPLVLGDDPEHPRPAVPAIRVDGQLERIDDAARKMARPPRTISLWLTDDASRVLLRASFDSELGRAKLDLTGYIPPSRKPKRGTPAAVLPGIEGAPPHTTP